MKNIVTIGGGSGTFNLVSGLKKLNNVFIHTIVTMSDDGGSTGFLRDEYGILPPGDLRRALVALSDDEKTDFLRKLFSYRFTTGLLKGQNLGNLIMLAAENICGNYGKALNEIEEMLSIEKGKVYPATLEKTRLLAMLENGDFVFGETNIDIPKHNPKLKIKDFFVFKEEYVKILKKIYDFDKKQLFDITFDLAKSDLPKENSQLKEVLNQADYIIFGPGDLFTSILPNVLVGDMINLIKNSKAKKIYISNLFTKLGETGDYALSDFLKIFEKYFGEDIFDFIIVQDWEKYGIDEDILANYKKENKEIVKIDLQDSRIIKADLLSETDVIRHDKNKLAKVLRTIIEFKIK